MLLCVAFNVAGAKKAATIGEDTHRNILVQLFYSGWANEAELSIFGDDYDDTPDGTCIRDYVYSET